MTIGADVRTTIGSLLGDRVYRLTAPPNSARPYATYALDDSEPTTALEGEGGLTHYDVELEVYADDPPDALAASIRAAMTGASLFKSVCRGFRDIYDFETNKPGVRLLFSIWQ